MKLQTFIRPHTGLCRLTFYVGLHRGHGLDNPADVQQWMAEAACRIMSLQWPGFTMTQALGFREGEHEPSAVFDVLLPGQVHLTEGQRLALTETLDQLCQQLQQESVLCIEHDASGVPTLHEALTMKEGEA